MSEVTVFHLGTILLGIRDGNALSRVLGMCQRLPLKKRTALLKNMSSMSLVERSAMSAA